MAVRFETLRPPYLWAKKYRGNKGNGGNNLGYSLFFHGFFIQLWVFYGLLIIPEWLIKVPDIFPYFLDDFWNFQNVHQVWPLTLLSYHKNASRNTRNYGIILKKYFSHISTFWDSKISKIVDTTVTSKL